MEKLVSYPMCGVSTSPISGRISPVLTSNFQATQKALADILGKFLVDSIAVKR